MGSRAPGTNQAARLNISSTARTKLHRRSQTMALVVKAEGEDVSNVNVTSESMGGGSRLCTEKAGSRLRSRVGDS